MLLFVPAVLGLFSVVKILHHVNDDILDLPQYVPPVPDPLPQPIDPYQEDLAKYEAGLIDWYEIRECEECSKDSQSTESVLWAAGREVGEALIRTVKVVLCDWKAMRQAVLHDGIAATVKNRFKTLVFFIIIVYLVSAFIHAVQHRNDVSFPWQEFAGQIAWVRKRLRSRLMITLTDNLKAWLDKHTRELERDQQMKDGSDNKYCDVSSPRYFMSPRASQSASTSFMSPRDSAMSPRNSFMSPRDSFMLPRDSVMSPRDSVMSSHERVMWSRDRVKSPYERVMSPRMLNTQKNSAHDIISCPGLSVSAQRGAFFIEKTQLETEKPQSSRLGMTSQGPGKSDIMSASLDWAKVFSSGGESRVKGVNKSAPRLLTGDAVDEVNKSAPRLQTSDAVNEVPSPRINDYVDAQHSITSPRYNFNAEMKQKSDQTHIVEPTAKSSTQQSDSSSKTATMSTKPRKIQSPRVKVPKFVLLMEQTKEEKTEQRKEEKTEQRKDEKTEPRKEEKTEQRKEEKTEQRKEEKTEQKTMVADKATSPRQHIATGSDQGTRGDVIRDEVTGHRRDDDNSSQPTNLRRRECGDVSPKQLDDTSRVQGVSSRRSDVIPDQVNDVTDSLQSLPCQEPLPQLPTCLQTRALTSAGDMTAEPSRRIIYFNKPATTPANTPSGRVENARRPTPPSPVNSPRGTSKSMATTASPRVTQMIVERKRKVVFKEGLVAKGNTAGGVLAAAAIGVRALRSQPGKPIINRSRSLSVESGVMQGDVTRGDVMQRVADGGHIEVASVSKN